MAWRALGAMRTHSSSRSRVRWRAESACSSWRSRSCFCSSQRAVVALEGDAPAVVELEDPPGDVVEEVAVVGDGHDRAVVVLQEALEPRHRLGVEVVGGLVEQQQVGLRSAAGGTAPPGVARRPTGWPTCGVARRQAQRVHGDLDGALEVPGAGGLDLAPRARPAPRRASRSRRRGRPTRRAPRRSGRGATAVSPTPSMTLPMTSLASSRWGSCSSSPTEKPGVRRASPVKSSSMPAMIRSSDDLPEPLAPITPILAPG